MIIALSAASQETRFRAILSRETRLFLGTNVAAEPTVVLKYTLDVLEIIERILGSAVMNEEKIKEAENRVRISILIFLRQTIQDIALLLEKIELVYAEFEYPEDMDRFITYMPVQDEVEYVTNSVDDSRRYLLNNFDLFIEQQKEKYKLKV